jgi:putative DNA primase/helicase
LNPQARAFLKELFDSKPEELYVLIWTLHDKASRWFRSLNEAFKYVEVVAGRDLYVGVGLSPADYGPTRRCVSNEVAGIVGLWADLDLRSDAHPKATLPGSVEQAMSILPPEFSPSIVVLTGNGIHIWWLFKEPWIFA